MPRTARTKNPSKTLGFFSLWSDVTRPVTPPEIAHFWRSYAIIGPCHALSCHAYILVDTRGGLRPEFTPAGERVGNTGSSLVGAC